MYQHLSLSHSSCYYNPCCPKFPHFHLLSYLHSQNLVLFLSPGPFPVFLFSLACMAFLHTVCVSSVFSLSLSLFLPRCTSRSVLCLLMWNLVRDVFSGSGLKGFLSDPPQLVALPYFLSLSLFPSVHQYSCTAISCVRHAADSSHLLQRFLCPDILMLIIWRDFRGRPSFIYSDAAVLTPLHTLDLLWVLSVWQISYAGGRRLCNVLCTRVFKLCCEKQGYGMVDFLGCAGVCRLWVFNP